jgi:hypothetical protein
MSTKTKVSTTSRKSVTKGSKPTEKSHKMTKNSITKSKTTKPVAKIKKPVKVSKTSTKSNQTWFDLKGYVGLYQINKEGMIRNTKTGYMLIGYGKNKDGYSLYNRNSERKIWYRKSLLKHQFGNNF